MLMQRIEPVVIIFVIIAGAGQIRQDSKTTKSQDH